jgi:hypothetical protein
MTQLMRFRLRSLLVVVAFVAVLSAAIAPRIRPYPVYPPGTWFGDGSILTLRMPDGSVVMAGPTTHDRVLAEYLAQSKRYYGAAKLPPGLPYWRANPARAGLGASAPSGTPIAPVSTPTLSRSRPAAG